LPRKTNGKTGLEKDLEGTAEVGMDLRKQGRSQSGLDDDIFGFKSEIDDLGMESIFGKKKGKKGSVDIGNIYGNIEI